MLMLDTQLETAAPVQMTSIDANNRTPRDGDDGDNLSLLTGDAASCSTTSDGGKVIAFLPGAAVPLEHYRLLPLVRPWLDQLPLRHW